VLPLTQARHAAIPGTIEGTGDEAIVLQGPNAPDLLQADASAAAGDFVVWIFSDTRDLVIDAVAPYVGTLAIPRDATAIGIKAQGPWRLEISTR